MFINESNKLTRRKNKGSFDNRKQRQLIWQQPFVLNLRPNEPIWIWFCPCVDVFLSNFCYQCVCDTNRLCLCFLTCLKAVFSQGRFDARVVFVGGEFVNLFGVLPISAKSVCRNFCCFSLLAFVTFTSMLAANLSCIHHVQMYRIRLVMEDVKMHYDCENGLCCKGYSRD